MKDINNNEIIDTNIYKTQNHTLQTKNKGSSFNMVFPFLGSFILLGLVLVLAIGIRF